MKNNEKAFTLAEILITLVVIGVVAALTIPNLVVKYQKMHTVSALKKEYSELYKAYTLSVEDNGLPSTWDFNLSALDFYKKYLSPYLKDEICTTSTGRCAKYYYKYMPSQQNYGYEFRPGVLLSDGSCIGLGHDAGLNLRLDLNCSKKPNILGRDIFLLGIIQDGGGPYCKMKDYFGFECVYCGACLPYGRSSKYQRTRAMFVNRCKEGEANFNCGGLIQYDNWQIKDDYPW